MIYAFTEEEKRQIESRGMLVVEFKLGLKMIERVNKVLHQVLDAFTKITEAAGKVISIFYKNLCGAMDNIRLAIEEIREKYNCPTCRRYRVAKILSKYTGLEKREVWKMTRYRRLARSCC